MYTTTFTLFVNFLTFGKPKDLIMIVLKSVNPNWPSKNPGNPSGPGRGNNPPGKKLYFKVRQTP